MREAYNLYVAGVSKPMRFDSFRRLITQGRIVSRKQGNWKEVQVQGLRAFIRTSAQSFEDTVGGLLQLTLKAAGGLPAQQSLLLGVMGAGSLEAGIQPVMLAMGPKRQILLDHVVAWGETHDLTLLSAGVTFEIEKIRIFVRTSGRCLIATTWEAPQFTEQLGDLVNIALIERAADFLVAQGTLEVIDDSDQIGQRTYRSSLRETQSSKR